MKQRNIDVFWGLGPKRDQKLVDTIREGKKLMTQKMREGHEDIVMYDQTSYEQGSRLVNEDPETICYFFRDGKIKSEKI